VVDLVLEGAGAEPGDRDALRPTVPRRPGTDRQPSLISISSFDSDTTRGLTSTVSGYGGLYG
jgi:hypothetical protein